MVNRTIADNFIRPDEANKAQYSLKDRGKATFIDKVRVRVLEEKEILSNSIRAFSYAPRDRYRRLRVSRRAIADPPP
jgi:predicted ATP-dependent Lon-type protease